MYQVLNGPQNDDVQLHQCCLLPSFGWGWYDWIATTQPSCLSLERSLHYELCFDRDDRHAHP